MAHSVKVFVSYSRKDQQFVTKFVEALSSHEDIRVLQDTADILPTEEWRCRLEQLIREADAVVFVLSPDSVVSEICGWEIVYAESLNKRIAPILFREVASNSIPKTLGKYQYVSFCSYDDFDDSMEKLVYSLMVNIDWVREHTRLGDLAQRWAVRGKVNDVLSLRGSELILAEQWLCNQPTIAPSPTTLHLDFIACSRKFAKRRKRNWITGLVITTIFVAGLGVFAVQNRLATMPFPVMELSKIDFCSTSGFQAFTDIFHRYKNLYVVIEEYFWKENYFCDGTLVIDNIMDGLYIEVFKDGNLETFNKKEDAEKFAGQEISPGLLISNGGMTLILPPHNGSNYRPYEIDAPLYIKGLFHVTDLSQEGGVLNFELENVDVDALGFRQRLDITFRSLNQSTRDVSGPRVPANAFK